MGKTRTRILDGDRMRSKRNKEIPRMKKKQMTRWKTRWKEGGGGGGGGGGCSLRSFHAVVQMEIHRSPRQLISYIDLELGDELLRATEDNIRRLDYYSSRRIMPSGRMIAAYSIIWTYADGLGVAEDYRG